MRSITRWLCRSLSTTFIYFAILLGISAAQTPSAIFPVTQEFGPPSQNSSFADFDGDGTMDLLYVTNDVNPTCARVHVVLNVADANPQTKTTSLCSGIVIGALLVGDVNGDKKLDVAFVASGFVGVMQGNGDGTFNNPDYYAASGARGLTFADLNGDGYSDIAALTTPSSTPALVVLVNKGSTAPGTFANPVAYPFSTGGATYFAGPVAGDFNGDGKQDVIFGTEQSLFIFYGQGDGTVRTATTQSLTSTSNYGLVAADFNKDGMSDIAVALNNASDTLQIFLGSSTGISPAATVSLPSGDVGTTGLGIVAGDLNGDGVPDVVTSMRGPTTVLISDGKGGFSQRLHYAASGDPTIVDLNGDGKLDLVLNKHAVSGSGFFLLPGNGDGTFSAVPSTAIDNFGDSISADVNGDGIADVVYYSAVGANPGAISIAIGRGDGTFALSNQKWQLNACEASIAAADFNGDGRIDIVSLEPSNVICGQNGASVGKLTFYAGNGDGTFKAGTSMDVDPTVGANGASGAYVGDFNGDGKLDIITPFGRYLGHTLMLDSLVLYTGKGDGTFSSGTVIATGLSNFGGLKPIVTAEADLNHDGKPDVIWGAVAGGGPGTVFLTNGDGTFKQSPLNVPVQPRLLADFNGDGYPDMLGDDLRLYLGVGDGTFNSTPSASFPTANFFAAAAGDLNGDGHLDLTLMSLDITSTYAYATNYQGDGRGNFTADPNSYLTSGWSYPKRIALTRLNNQAPSNSNKLDLLASSSFGLTSLLNQGNPAPTAPTPLSTTTTLTASSSTTSPNATITLTASVRGISPAGTVTFTSASTTLGSATLTNGVATLQSSFAKGGTFPVVASYGGDPTDAASSSQPVTINVADFQVALSSSSASVQAGQSASVTLSLTPMAGYTGTLTFSCENLPSLASCAFSPASMPASGTSPINATVTISTKAAVAKLSPTPAFPWKAAGSLAFAFGIVVTFSPAKRRKKTVIRTVSLYSVLLLGMLGLQACGGSGSTPRTQPSPGTPKGSQTVQIKVTDSAGLSHSTPFDLTVQ